MNCSHCNFQIPADIEDATVFCPACGQALAFSKSRARRDARTMSKTGFNDLWADLIDLEKNAGDATWVPATSNGAPLPRVLQDLRRKLRDGHPITRFLVEHPFLAALVLVLAGAGLGFAASLLSAAAAALISLGITVGKISALLGFLAVFSKDKSAFMIPVAGICAGVLLALAGAVLAVIGTALGIAATICTIAGGALAVAALASLLHAHRHELAAVSRMARDRIATAFRRRRGSRRTIKAIRQPKQRIIVHRRPAGA